MDNFSLQHDLETTHTIDYGKNKINIRREGQYGFWRIHMDKGQVPSWMSGEYTALDKAVAHVNRWLAEKRLTAQV